MIQMKNNLTFLLLFCQIFVFIPDRSLSQVESVFHAGDKLMIWMWRHEDLSGEFQVREDGTLFLPLVGDITAEGLTVQQLEKSLTEAYSTYLRNPHVLVTPFFRVTILGAVKIPGSYTVSGTEKITDLIAMAGGLDDKAVIKKTQVTRGNEVLTINVNHAIQAEKTLKELGIQSGDIVIIPKSRWPSLREWSLILSTLALGVTLYNAFKD
jgi:polysaccharide export outer membrane protein